MAKVIPIGEPENEAERLAIRHLRDNLPDHYTVIHNFELVLHKGSFEIDLAVVAPHCVYVIDVKGVRGEVEVIRGRWYPRGRQPYASPVGKIRQHARKLKGLLQDQNRRDARFRKVFVGGLVLLTAPDACLDDPDRHDIDDVVHFRDCVRLLKDASRVDAGRFENNIQPIFVQVRDSIIGKARKPSGPKTFGSWQVVESLGQTALYREFRAQHEITGAASGRMRLRVYDADIYLTDEQEQREQQTRLSNAFMALSRMPAHSNIATAREFFSPEPHDCYVLVLDDLPGSVLRQHLRHSALALTVDQKLSVIRQLLMALAHAHNHGVTHRNLTPDAVMLGTDGVLRLTDFDYSRPQEGRSLTIAEAIVDDIEEAYSAPELLDGPGEATPASDVFSAGVIFYELLAGQRPYQGLTQLFDVAGKFPTPLQADEYMGELPEGVGTWLQGLCAFEAGERPSASQALEGFEALFRPNEVETKSTPEVVVVADPDWKSLPPGYQLTDKFVVQERLGAGAFGVVYRVIDTLGDIARVVKLVLRDNESVVERVRIEYRNLLRLDHPHVVRVFSADFLHGARVVPYIVFEHVEGQDLRALMDGGGLSDDERRAIGIQATEALDYMHAQRAYHCDIKPGNLLWTDKGIKLIDFNVSVRSEDGPAMGGGTRRYLPPDLDTSRMPTDEELADRDLYALGVVLYELWTGDYPMATGRPGEKPRDPRELSEDRALSDAASLFLLKAVATHRVERFGSAREFLDALKAVQWRPKERKAPRPAVETMDGSVSLPLPPLPSSGEIGPLGPKINPNVTHMVSLYSQSRHSNHGTRGLDDFGRKTYVATRLDTALTPAILGGEFKLVVITGNAGDGKTAYLQRLEDAVRDHQGEVTPVHNGARFEVLGRRYLTNYDGSQDEESRDNDDVLLDFFAPFEGGDAEKWSPPEVRLIAINEGRLVDFLESHGGRFGRLREVALAGLDSGQVRDGVVLVNLNLRSVVADGDTGESSIFERQLRALTRPELWEVCHSCSLKDRCYARHNAQTLQEPKVGQQVLQRLRTLYTTTHLRGRLHITLRDLRSALSYLLVGNRTCEDIHALYASGSPWDIAEGFYFNSWRGEKDTQDRLLSLLAEIDVGQTANPRLDRTLDFTDPTQQRHTFAFDERGDYDIQIGQRLFNELPRNATGQIVREHLTAHRRFLAHQRRRFFFERRDELWSQMLPYRSVRKMERLASGQDSASGLLPIFLEAINRGEGLHDPGRLGGRLALEIRRVERGTIRSYRLFKGSRFSVSVQRQGFDGRFVEHMPEALNLRYNNGAAQPPELLIDLDIFEMLMRLNQGYRPSLEELQGRFLNLEVFKNTLSSTPYQEVLLTTTGADFYQLTRSQGGKLTLKHLGGEVSA